MLEEGLQKPEEVEQATNSYRFDSDIIGGFISDSCILNPLARGKTIELYLNMKSGVQTTKKEPIALRTFISILQERGFKKTRIGAASTSGFQGIGLNQPKYRQTDTIPTLFWVFPIEKNTEKNKVKNASVSVGVSVSSTCGPMRQFHAKPRKH